MNVADPAPDDQTLLRYFTEHGSEQAFAELVRRHLPQMHAAARRRMNENRALAAGVTQTGFVDGRTICPFFYGFLASCPATVRPLTT